MAADLHIHTHYSDGLDSPAYVVACAQEAGLTALAICDHDCVAGVQEAVAAAGESLQVITGVEINAEEAGREYHILGYGFSLEAAGLARLTEWLQQTRLDRLGRFLAVLGKHGIQVAPEEVLAVAGPGAVGRPHLAKVLAAKRYASGIKEAFRKFLAPGRPTYVPRERVSPARAVEIVRQVGGVPVLAHPVYVTGRSDLSRFVDLGIEGVEVAHPLLTPGQTEVLRGLACHWGLLTTAGSDYHGGMMEEGVQVGAVSCSDEEVAALLNRVPQL